MSGITSDPDQGNRANVCVRIDGPAAPVITLEQARQHLRLDAIGSPPANIDDELVQGFTQSATDDLDGWMGDLGRALIEQTWEYRAPYFAPCEMLIPLPPLVSVTSVKYLDAAGAEQTLAPSAYRVRLGGQTPGAIVLNAGEVWPQTYEAEDAVRIRFVCGYGADGDAVPGNIKSWIKLRLGQLYEHREAVIAGTTFAPMPFMDSLIDRYRVRRVWQ